MTQDFLSNYDVFPPDIYVLLLGGAIQTIKWLNNDRLIMINNRQDSQIGNMLYRQIYFVYKYLSIQSYYIELTIYSL